MGKHYKHLQPQDRIKIYELLFQGNGIKEIADTTDFHISTIYRELEHNSSKFGYRPDLASQYYITRRQRLAKLESNLELQEFVVARLKEGWSPDSIADRLKNHIKGDIISRETIYRFIYSPRGIALKLYRYLMKKRRFRYPRIKRRRQTIINSRKTPIKERPISINQRETFGHWEGDLVLFKHTKTNLFTLRERKSRFIVVIKNQSRQTHSTFNTLVNYMKNKLCKTVKSFTFDNDPAFACHEQIANVFDSSIYFCEPYKSYQKGGIENANKLIRTQLPSRTRIDDFDQDTLDNIIKKFNDRPMRCLNYQTASEVFFRAFA